MTEPQYVAQTLAWCNARRKERGKKPLKKLPRGTQWDAESCPCGKATGLLVYPGQAFEERTAATWMPVPRSVDRFVRAFDDGRFPQYEAANS